MRSSDARAHRPRTAAAARRRRWGWWRRGVAATCHSARLRRERRRGRLRDGGVRIPANALLLLLYLHARHVSVI